MPYRNPDTARIATQMAAHQFAHAGQPAVWRTYVSASAGIPVAGLGNAPQYAERTITALFAPVRQDETQTPAGMIAGAEFVCTTRERLGRRDELRWRGTAYRVESDPVPATIAGTWLSVLKRGER